MTSLKTLAFATLAALTAFTATVSTSSTAEAGWRPEHAFAAGVATGFIAPVIIGAATRPHYVAEEEVIVRPRRACYTEERYNRYGDYIGTRRVCRSRY
ncbi:MAG: hypothetical protein JNM13_06360 [Hyphomicrobiaceae bacterium]|nr:hypothetical protein [Hyphomicrobiaceae bacterium]